MACSMTGFGRFEQVLNGREISVEIKSVNSRYFEYFSRLPRGHSFLEDEIKKAVAQKVSRGKLELNLLVQDIGEGNVQVAANVQVAKEYHAALQEIAAACAVPADITAQGLGRFSDVFTLKRTEKDEEEIKRDVLQVVLKALEQHSAMRATEGEGMKQDITQRLKNIANMLAQVEQGSGQRVEKYTAKLYERLQEVLQDRIIDDARILTEAAIFADKTAVDEETVRLASHLAQFKEILDTEGAIGRKLDFLTQEVNREINTIGSKCQELAITRLVIDMKAEAEKIREQIQNLE